MVMMNDGSRMNAENYLTILGTSDKKFLIIKNKYDIWGIYEMTVLTLSVIISNQSPLIFLMKFANAKDIKKYVIITILITFICAVVQIFDWPERMRAICGKLATICFPFYCRFNMLTDEYFKWTL